MPDSRHSAPGIGTCCPSGKSALSGVVRLPPLQPYSPIEYSGGSRFGSTLGDVGRKWGRDRCPHGFDLRHRLGKRLRFELLPSVDEFLDVRQLLR